MFLSRSIRCLPPLRKFIHIEHTKNQSGKRLPEPWDVVTGVERWQALQYAKGNIDPFFRLPVKRGPGTKDCPNIIFSAYDHRMVGCVCHEDSMSIVWWCLHEGFPRRCNCNYWFVLERIKDLSIYED